MENTSLATILEHPEEYTMLIPIETVSHIPEIMAPTIKSVRISTDLNDKEIYVQEKAQEAYTDRTGKYHPATPARYSLTKKALTKLAEAAGIKQVSSEPVLPTICQKCVSVNKHAGRVLQCGNCKSNQDVRYKVTIAFPQLTGETLYFVDHHEIDVGTVTDSMTDKQKNEFLKHRAQICEAKAMNGAIRTALQIKGSYLIEEFQKPFVVGYLVPNLDNDAVKRVAIESMFQSRNNLFGHAPGNGMDALPVNKVGIDRGHYDQDYDDVVDVQEAEDSMAGCPAPADPEPQEAEQEIEDRTMDFMCDKCRAVISRKVWEYSRDKYGRPLCMKCQRGAERI